MNASRTWYVITDGGRARLLQKRAEPDAFETRREFVSAEIHHKTHDLGTDRPGRAQESVGGAHHAVEPRQDLHLAEKQRFVGEVAATLNEANAQDAFDRLFLVAPAHALETLSAALDAETTRKVAGVLRKDLTKVPNADLGKHLVHLSEARAG